MGKRKTQQYVGGSKEAQVAVVGSSGLDQEQQQEHIYTPNDAEYHRYSELLRTFDDTMQRWRTRVCIPEYFKYHRQKKDEPELWQWEYEIAYPPTNPPRVVPQKSYPGVNDTDTTIGMRVVDEDGGYLRKFIVEAMGSAEDPYTNEDLALLRVKLWTAGKPNQRHFYSLRITEGIYAEPGHKRWKSRSLEYCVQGLNTGEPHLKIKKSYGYEEAELLPEPHAIALFNLMDRFIPPGTPTVTPQSERRARQELGTPSLPAPRRTPGR